MRRPSAVITALALAAAATVGLAAPASADHLVGVSRLGCSAGPLAGDFPGAISTTKVTVHKERNGVVRTTCHFTKLPREYYLAEYDHLWQRPTKATRSMVTACVLDSAADPVFGLYGEGTLLLTPGGTATVDCTFVTG